MGCHTDKAAIDFPLIGKNEIVRKIITISSLALAMPD
jgi:hypothetical protein